MSFVNVSKCHCNFFVKFLRFHQFSLIKHSHIAVTRTVSSATMRRPTPPRDVPDQGPVDEGKPILIVYTQYRSTKRMFFCL